MPVRMDEIEPGLFVGGIAAVAINNLNENRITHILALLRQKINWPQDRKLLHIQAADADDQDLLSRFDECYEFISKCLEENGRILVHCPRDSFTDQLDLYHKMGYKVDKSFVEYKLFFFKCLSLRFGYGKSAGMYPRNPAHFAQKTSHLLEEDPDSDHGGSGSEKKDIFECKSCRRGVFREASVISHVRFNGPHSGPCVEDYHVLPIKWMDCANISGNLYCPGCNTEMGFYAWMGVRCNCEVPVIPWFQIYKSKVQKRQEFT